MITPADIQRAMLLRRYRLQQNIPCLSWDAQTSTTNVTYTMLYSGGGNIDWGDGSSEDVTGGNRTAKSHIYATSGLYKVVITGNITYIQAGSNAASRALVRTIHSMNLDGYMGNLTGTSPNGEFYGCGNATLGAQLSFASTTQAMQGTFYGCSGLTSLPDGLIPSGVTNLTYAFQGCTGLTSLPSGLIPSGYTGSLTYTFYGCSGLTSLPSGLIPSGVTDISYAFQGCTGLTSLPSGLIPSGVSNLFYAFRNCTGLTEINTNIWPASFTSSSINISYAFARSSVMSGKPTGTVPAALLWGDTSKTWTSTQAFRNCTSLDNYDNIPSGWK